MLLLIFTVRLAPHSHPETLIPPVVDGVLGGVELLVPRIVRSEQVLLFAFISVPTGQTHANEPYGFVLKRLVLQQF